MKLHKRIECWLLACLLAVGCGWQKNYRQENIAPNLSSGVANKTSPAAAPNSEREDSEAETASKGPLALARLYERRGQPQKARQIYHSLAQTEPENPLVHHRLGVMAAQQTKFDEANQHFQRALELTPSNSQLLSDAGYSYYLQDRLDEAEALLRRALELDPQNTAAANNLAVLLGEQERYEESLSFFQRTGNEASTYANMGFVLAQQGRLEEAKAYYSEALTRDENLRPAAQAMIQLARYDVPSGDAPSSETVSDEPVKTRAPQIAKIVSKEQETPTTRKVVPARQPTLNHDKDTELKQASYQEAEDAKPAAEEGTTSRVTSPEVSNAGQASSPAAPRQFNINTNQFQAMTPQNHPASQPTWQVSDFVPSQP